MNPKEGDFVLVNGWNHPYQVYSVDNYFKSIMVCDPKFPPMDHKGVSFNNIDKIFKEGEEIIYPGTDSEGGLN